MLMLKVFSITCYANQIFLTLSLIDKQLFGKELNLTFHSAECLTEGESVTEPVLPLMKSVILLLPVYL